MKQSAEQINQTIIPVFISVSRLVSSFHTCSLKARSDWTVTSPTFDVAPAQADSAPSVVHSTIYLPSPPSQRVSDPAPLSETQPGPVPSATFELQVKLSAPRAERSSTAVEDGLMVALIAVVRGWCPVSRHHAVLPCHVGAVCGLRGIADIIDNPIATPTAGDTEAG